MRIPLYLRIWGAVVLAVAVLTAAFAWLWQSTAYQPRPREIVIRSESGEVLGQAVARPAFVPGQGIEFPVAMKDGSTVVIQMPPRRRGHHQQQLARLGAEGGAAFPVALVTDAGPIQARRLLQRLIDQESQ